MIILAVIGKMENWWGNVITQLNRSLFYVILVRKSHTLIEFKMLENNLIVIMVVDTPVKNVDDYRRLNNTIYQIFSNILSLEIFTINKRTI